MDNCTGCDEATTELPVNAWLLLRLSAAVLRAEGAQRGEKLNAPRECLTKLMVKRVGVWLDLCTRFFFFSNAHWESERLHIESRGEAKKTAVRHASQTRTFLDDGRASLIKASRDQKLSTKDGSLILQGKHWRFCCTGTLRQQYDVMKSWWVTTV